MKDKDPKKGRQTQDIIQDKKLWEMTFNAVPDAIAIIDRNHQIVRINKSMAERLGVTPEQGIGLPCYAVVHGLESPPPFCPHSRLLKDGTDQREEVLEQRMGGTFIVTVSPLFDKMGHLQGSVHVAHDITERKSMEDDLLLLNRDLQETNKNLQAAYQWMRDCRDLSMKSRYEECLSFLIDSEGKIEWISEKVLEYVGQSRNELIARHIEVLFKRPYRDRFRDTMKHAWIGIIEPITVEIRLDVANKGIFEAAITRMTSSDQRRLLVLLAPKTEPKQEIDP